MENRIKIGVLCSISLYLITSFIKWDILWIRELPNYDNDDRFFTLFLSIGLNVVAQLTYNIKIIENGSKK